METPPEITVYDHAGWSSQQLARLQAFAERALPAALQLPPVPTGAKAPSPLQSVTEIEVSLISDTAIAQVHADFMHIDGATDVITFHHGEILVSVDTGRSRAEEFGHSVEKEIALYIAHGLLHLHGYDDDTAEAAETMRLLQEQLLARCWRE